jgi:hypothetical protein
MSYNEPQEVAPVMIVNKNGAVVRIIDLPDCRARFIREFNACPLNRRDGLRAESPEGLAAPPSDLNGGAKVPFPIKSCRVHA